MKWIKTVCIAVVFSMVAGGMADAAPAIEKPVVLEDALLSVTASDLHGLLDGVGSVAAQVTPMMNAMMLKSMIGMQLGDPGLAGIAPGKGLAIVVLDPTNVFAVIEVGEVQMPAYTNAVATMGVQSRYSNGLLVVGQTVGQVDKGMGYAEAVKNRLLAKRSPSLRIALKPAAIVEKNSDQIQGLLQMMPALLGQSMMQAPGATLGSTQTTLRFLEGELRVLLSLAGQCDVAEVVLMPENGSLRISEIFVPKSGTRLATLCDAPAVNPPNSKIESGYLGDGAVRFDSSLANPEALVDFTVAETEQLFKEMEIKDVDLPSLVAFIEKWWSVSGGSVSETVGFGGEPGLSVGYLMDVKDEAEALAVLKGMPKDIEPFLGLYEDIGMPMSMEFKENAREYNGVKIHQFGVSMSMTNQPPEVAAQMATMNLTNMVYDIAITDGVVIYAMGEAKVETIIDRLKDESFTPVPLKARSVYPEGGFYYFDLDVGEYMAFVTAFMPDAGMQQMAALFQGVEPVTSAGFKADGRVMWSANVPGELIAKYGQMAMMMQMQQPQGGLPQATPVQ